MADDEGWQTVASKKRIRKNLKKETQNSEPPDVITEEPEAAVAATCALL